MTSEGLVFDHIVYGVNDLDAAAKRLERESGLVASGGGVHPGGTKNLAALFADETYIELLAVNDPDSPGGRWLGESIANGDRLLAWAVRTTDIEAVAKRVGLDIQTGSIERPDGAIGTWRHLGGSGRGDRPFFIQYDQARVAQGAPGGISWVEVSGDRAKIATWLGHADLDVRIKEGEPRLVAVGVITEAGEFVLR